MQIVSIKTKLVFQTEEDKLSIISMLEKARDCWNFISEKHFSVNEKGWLDCKNSIVELHEKVYFPTRERFGIKSSILVQVENSVIHTYRSIKKNNHKITKPAKKNKLSLSVNSDCFSIKEGQISLISLNKRIKCKFLFYKRLEEFLSKYKHGDPTIFVKNNEVWISLPFKIEITQTNPNLAVGIDLGICRFAATSEGNLFISKKTNKKRRQIRHLKRKLQSKKTKSARKHLKKIRHKEKNQNLNFNHHLANAIIKSTQASVLVLEDLNIQKMKSSKEYNKTTKKVEKTYGRKKRTKQSSMAEIRFLITYKAYLAGKSVIFVNPAYTSQTDHLTGKRDGERKGRRYYAKGKYNRKGLVYDSDVNAAVNIAKLSELPFSCARTLDGQGQVIDPIVC